MNGNNCWDGFKISLLLILNHTYFTWLATPIAYYIISIIYKQFIYISSHSGIYNNFFSNFSFLILLKYNVEEIHNNIIIIKCRKLRIVLILFTFRNFHIAIYIGCLIICFVCILTELKRKQMKS